MIRSASFSCDIEPGDELIVSADAAAPGTVMITIRANGDEDEEGDTTEFDELVIALSPARAKKLADAIYARAAALLGEEP